MYIKPELGSTRVKELRRIHILQALRSMQSKGLSRSSIEQGNNVISGVIEFAIDNEYLEVNPTHGTLKRLGLSRKADRKPISIFSREEISIILKTCKSYRLDYHPLLLTAFRTGMRLGEVLALRWENVNWRQQYIVVESSWRNGRLTGTKTNRSRSVDMSSQLAQELRELLRQRKEEALKQGTVEVIPIIFHTNGEHTSQNTVRNIWKRILAKAELDYRKFHSIRHTFASLLLADNHPLNYVKDMMGHHSIQVTADVYGHLLPDQNKTAVNSLDDATKRNLSATTEIKKAATI